LLLFAFEVWMNGIIVVDKPQDMTSHDVINIMRRATGVKRIGHSGTLDPMATGVLPIFIGKATRLIEYATSSGGAQAKAYSATMRLGVQTDTADIWGEEITESSAPMPPDDEIRTVIASFVGEQVQVPPMYSAIKVNGKKLYEYARAGQELPEGLVKTRTVAISRIDIANIDRAKKEISIDVVCSKGTYIRTLCADIGNVFGTFAAMTELRRTMSDGFTLTGSVTADFLKTLPRATPEGGGVSALKLLPMDFAVRHMARVELSERGAALFCNGVKVGMTASSSGGELRRVYMGDEFLGIAKYDGKVLKAEKVIR
jgi:tRNA pseudouridine55 synthase